jgi:outer membrane protein TolC
VAKRDVAFKTAEAYVRLLEAARLLEVANASVTQLEAQRKQAQSLYANGVIGKNDLLRAELALANAKERVIETTGQVDVARGRLATLMALPTSTIVEPLPIPPDPPPSDEPTVESAQAHARERRLEIREVAARTAQADVRVDFARKKLFPRIDAVANYTHFEGSQFQQTNAAYVGATAAWDAWDWGTTWKGIDEASARRDKEVMARLKLEDELGLEARQAFVGAQTARAALDVARTAREQAEENYRIVSRRFEAAEATSFDVVDAEALLTQARARVETALYGYHVARLALERATGGSSPRVR